METYNLFMKLKFELGSDLLLHYVIQTLNDKALYDILKYVARMNEISINE